MFGGKKNEVIQGATNATPSPNSNNSIVAGTSINGNIIAGSDMRIDGILVGNINCNGKLILGPDGKIEGEIICQNAVIEGLFSGKINCAELLNVRETARITGDIITDKLIVQSGATFNVNCKMGEDSSMVKENVRSMAEAKVK